MPEAPDDRSLVALAWDRASQVTGISISMVLPGVIGYGVDVWLEWPYILTIAGFAGGMTLGIFQLVRFAEQAQKKSKDSNSIGSPSTDEIQGSEHDGE